MFEELSSGALVGAPDPCRAGKRQPRRLLFEQLEPRRPMAAQVVIDPAQPLGKISPDLIGTNVIYSREHDALWSDGRVAASLKNLNTGFMRYPGGEVTSFYHWNKLTGVPFVDSWNPNTPAASQPPHRWMSLDEYIQQARLAGAKPLVGVNIQSGHNHNRVADGVAEAVALVRYAKNRGYGVQHYFIDNEQYASNAKMSAKEYADYVNLYATAMRKVDPGLKIVVNWQNRVDNGLKTILHIAGKNIDIVDFHCYWNWGDATFNNWRGRGAMTHRGETYAAKIKAFRQEVDRAGLDIKLAVFEWNLGPTANRAEQPSPFQAALVNSEMFMQFVWGRLDAAAFWPLHYSTDSRDGEAGRSLLTADELQQSPTYQMLSMYKGLLGSQLVPAHFAGSGVLATAGFQPANDTTTVMLLNKTWQSSDLRLKLGRFLQQPGSYQVQAQVFRAAGGDLAADQGEIVNVPFVLDKASGEIRLTAAGFTLTKVTIKHLAPAAPQPVVQQPAPVVPPVTPPASPMTVGQTANKPNAGTSQTPPKVAAAVPPRPVTVQAPGSRSLLVPRRALARLPAQTVVHEPTVRSAHAPLPKPFDTPRSFVPTLISEPVLREPVVSENRGTPLPAPQQVIVTSEPVAHVELGRDELFAALTEDLAETTTASAWQADDAQDMHLTALLGAIHEDETVQRRRRNGQTPAERLLLLADENL